MNFRIAFFCPTLELGGAQRTTAILANAFAARGHSVDVCAADASGIVRQDFVSSVRVIDFLTGRALPSLWPLRRYLIEDKPHVLICIQSHAGLTGIIANALSGANTPVIVVEQSSTLSRLSEKSHFDYYKFRTLIRLLYPRAARVIAISRDVRKDLLLHARLKNALIEVISNPAAIPVMYDETNDVEDVWDGWPTTTDPVIATVGRLVEVKDIPVLLRAFAKLHAQRPLQLVIIGDGPDRAKLEQIAHELGIHRDTHFLGARNHPWRYLKRARVFVMSSRFEGFGNTLVEAMAVGCAVVSTDCPGGPSEILEDGKYGPLVPVGDADAMADAIAGLLDSNLDPEFLRKRAGDYGEPVIDAYLDLIARVSNPCTSATS